MIKNKLYLGDNYQIMRELPTSSVDLILTDPPFNSGKNYNLPIEDPEQQITAFTDTWAWDDTAIATRSLIEEQLRSSKQYENLNNTLIGYDHIFDFATSGPNASMRSYLTFLGIRLIEMYRILKNTGSIYLHCDPSASHYLKGLLDVIFGSKNFRNEIIWHYSAGHSPRKDFKRKHDVILRYTKTPKFVFNQPRMQYAEKTKHRFNKVDEDGRMYSTPGAKHKNGELKRYYWDNGTPMDDVFTYMRGIEFNQIGSTAKERLGYPTQKPRYIYEIIIKASSNEGDIVLDPFAGCGTTIDAAQYLNRKWIGIDITNLALTPMEQRLSSNYNLVKGKDYQILGYPTNMQEIERFLKVEKKYHEVANWAINELGLMPTKDIGDGGIDGIGYGFTWTPEGMKQETCKIVAEVKTGQISTTQIRAFCHSMNEFDAKIGIIVTFHKPTKGMLEYQEKQGRYEHNGKTYFRLQILHIDETYFTHNGISNQIKIPGVIRKTMEV